MLTFDIKKHIHNFVRRNFHNIFPDCPVNAETPQISLNGVTLTHISTTYYSGSVDNQKPEERWSREFDNFSAVGITDDKVHVEFETDFQINVEKLYDFRQDFMSSGSPILELPLNMRNSDNCLTGSAVAIQLGDRERFETSSKLRVMDRDVTVFVPPRARLVLSQTVLPACFESFFVTLTKLGGTVSIATSRGLAATEEIPLSRILSSQLPAPVPLKNLSKVKPDIFTYYRDNHQQFIFPTVGRVTFNYDSSRLFHFRDETLPDKVKHVCINL